MDLAFSINDNYTADDFEPTGPQGNCRRCNNSTELMCMRCGDCYCSKRCQDIDWPVHRYICFPKPSLIKLNSVPTDDNTPDIGNVVEPVHLKEQLRIMSNVCLDFMQQLDAKFNTNTKNSIPYQINSGILEADTNKNGTTTKPTARRSNLQELRLTSIDDSISNGPKKTASEKSSTVSSKAGDDKLDDQLFYVIGFRVSNRIALCQKKFYDNGSYTHILDRIHNYGQNAPLIRFTPQIHAYVLTSVPKYGVPRFARGKVLPPQKDGKFADRFRLELLDYGNVVFRRANELRQITQELAELPILVKMFHLSKVELYMQKEHYPFLSSFEKRFCKMVKVAGATPDKFAIELYDAVNGASINECIEDGCRRIKQANGSCNNSTHENEKLENLPCSSKAKEPVTNLVQRKSTTENSTRVLEPPFVEHVIPRNTHENEKLENLRCSSKPKEPVTNLVQRKSTTENSTRVLEPPFVEHVIPRNTRNAKAVILDTSAVEHGYLACILQMHMPRLQEIQIYLSKARLNEGEPYQPVDNEYVIAKFEDDWYRGKVISVSPDGQTFDVSYIDFLNESTLTSVDIRRYPKDLTTDCYTTLCVLDGLPSKVSEKLKEYLTNALELNTVIHIDRVVEIVEERVALIECCEFLQLIRNKNLI